MGSRWLKPTASPSLSVLMIPLVTACLTELKKDHSEEVPSKSRLWVRLLRMRVDRNPVLNECTYASCPD